MQYVFIQIVTVWKDYYVFILYHNQNAILLGISLPSWIKMTVSPTFVIKFISDFVGRSCNICTI